MLAFSSLLGNVEGQNIYRIWYDKPASYWEEALPVGNGRIAAMVFGDPQLEQIQLNEETVSAGSPYQNYNEEAKTALPEMRRLIFEGIYRRNICIIYRSTGYQAYQSIQTGNNQLRTVF